MKKLLFLALLAANAMGLTAKQQYELNYWMGPVALRNKLGDLLLASGTGSTLADGKIWVGSSGNVSAAVTPSGDVTLTNAGVTAIGAGKVTNAMLDGTVLKYADTTITTGQMLALNATPKTLLAAPGAGLVNVVAAVYATMTYNSVAYVCNAAGLIVKYTDGSGATAGPTLTQGFCQSAASAMQYVVTGVTAITPVANAAVVLHAGSADPTTGNSGLKVRVYYRTVPNPLP